MDEGLSRAVLKVFVELYREGLIYKDKRLVNWDPKLLTAISDLEVVQVETKGHLWHLRYPIEGKTSIPTIRRPSSSSPPRGRRPCWATPRSRCIPTTSATRHLVGKNVILPLVGRRIPIVADDYSDPEKGSGAVKITPAHDFNDFEVGKRHDLPQDQYSQTRSQARLRRQSDFTPDEPRLTETDATRSCTGSTASRRARRSSRGWKRRVWSRRSSRTRTPCRMATAPTW